MALARWYKASITVLQVSAPVPGPAYAPGVPGFAGVDFPPPHTTEVLASATRFVRAEACPDIPIDIVTRAGDAATEILAQARNMDADLLVIGTHGRSGFDRLVLGSVTEKVLRRAACPVLSVPPRAPGASPSAAISFKRILCPVDFSDSSMNALRYATSLGQEAAAHLTLLHVMEYDPRQAPELYDTLVSDARLTIAESRERSQAISRERLDTALSDEARTYCSVDTIVADGKPYREILRVADERHADLIVIGVRGRSPMDLMLFGSTTQHVVRLARCPVLTLREPLTRAE
jgi:nucleotide-binding universal stress UspA family protein